MRSGQPVRLPGRQPGSLLIEPGDRHALLRELAAQDRATVTCSSPSMEPAIRVGDVVAIRRATRVRVGEVALFETADGAALVLHRVVLTAPRVPWIAHVGDASSPLATAIFHRSRLIGVASDVPRRRPRAAAVAIAAARLARRAARAALR